jgi:hypothetical protein
LFLGDTFFAKALKLQGFAYNESPFGIPPHNVRWFRAGKNVGHTCLDRLKVPLWANPRHHSCWILSPGGRVEGYHFRIQRGQSVLCHGNHIGSAATLGQSVPLTLRGLVGERQFWVYVYALFLYWALPGVAASLGFILGAGVYLTAIDPEALLTADRSFAVVAFASIPAALTSAYVTARLSLLLPAIAAGEELSISAAWKRSTGNVMKIAAAFLVAVGIFFLFQQMIVEMAKLASATFIALIASIAIIVVTFCQALINGTVAGSIYRQLQQ